MQIPASPHFTPIDLSAAYNAKRSELPNALRTPGYVLEEYGPQAFLGIPFTLGQAGQPDVVLLDGSPVTLDLGGAQATYILFLHAAEDIVTVYQQGLADTEIDGNTLGATVSDYQLDYADGTSVTTPILRRFAIQQSRIRWGASAFAAMPATKPGVVIPTTEEHVLGRVASTIYGRGETRHASGRESAPDHLWIYALPNPHPDKPIQRVICIPHQERSAIYGVALTQLADHPLRPGVRRKLYLTLPPGIQPNAIGEFEGLELDLGTVISARVALDYDHDAWVSGTPVVEPGPNPAAVIVEYSAHPAARLYVDDGTPTPACYELAKLDGRDAVEVAPALRPVTIRVVEKDTKRPVAVRLHIHGAAGEYLPPRGHHRKVNDYWFEDHYAEFQNVHNQYSFIDGECIVDLPLGTVYVEMNRGYEVAPLRATVTIGPETSDLSFEMENVLHWREAGWVTADTHVHFLSPQTALLEGKAQGVHVVNLLASQWGEMFSNVGDFDGKTTLGARDFGGDGEFLVRVGTENRMQVLGHISLLGYSGAMIHPLCTGGPSESALGDPLEVSMAEWAQRCIDQGGLVVMPHAPNPQLERAADFVLGVVNATEMMSFNPFNPTMPQISPYGLADWYRYLNLGYQIPVVGGSDKMGAAWLLGGMRTYAHLGEREFTYDNWMAAVRAGNTFVTVGPLAALQVEGVAPGGQLQLPANGGAVTVTWKVESASMPIDQVEIIVGGLAVESVDAGGQFAISGTTSVRISDSTWIALRVRGSYRNRPGEIAAHTSAVQVVVAGRPIFTKADALTVLEQIEGALAYVDTLAPRPEAQRFKQLRATLEAAYNRLHQRMHNAGVFHQHTPLHDHAHTREH